MVDTSRSFRCAVISRRAALPVYREIARWKSCSSSDLFWPAASWQRWFLVRGGAAGKKWDLGLMVRRVMAADAKAFCFPQLRDGGPRSDVTHAAVT
jgi:hypothetical protein